MGTFHVSGGFPPIKEGRRTVDFLHLHLGETQPTCSLLKGKGQSEGNPFALRDGMKRILLLILPFAMLTCLSKGQISCVSHFYSPDVSKV